MGQQIQYGKGFSPRASKHGSFLCMTDNKKNTPARTSPGLPRSCDSRRNTKPNGLCVPSTVFRNTPDLTYVQSEGNYYFKTSDTYQKLKPCSINIFDCLTTPDTSDEVPIISSCQQRKGKKRNDLFSDLLSHLQHPLGIHYIRTILFSLPVNCLKDVRDYGLDKGGTNPYTQEYRLSSIICDVASFRLFKPTRTEPLEQTDMTFLQI